MKPSTITHVLFRRQNGWTPTSVVRWLEQNGFPAYAGDLMTSQGGETLKSGDYLVVRVVRSVKGFTSFGYGKELKNHPGVWFKFGGYRRR